jgi:hypothetical protein
MQVIKKIFCAAFLFVLAAAVFAVDFGLSVGGGALLGGNFTSSETDPTDLSKVNAIMPAGLANMTYAYETGAFDVGAFVFVDATYAELSAAYFAEIGKVTGISNTITHTPAGAAAAAGGIPLPPNGPISQPDEDYLSHVIIVDLLGKYPFVLNGQFTVFPLLGVGLKFPIAGNDFSDKEHDITWGVVAKAGGGLD